ncbi:TrkH family potassium uptake protein [Alkalimonas sp. MEB108]|uniref:TrkH family potassium uptake protein n=1 Tax=Alkalimonas cellulosilytica TaxID=3058395 RepID=A0ABU7J4N8_9GAMM|nr:TrkH family potassium uptake protein [Alkalimonas sp. MEB108]MEE2001354.1 TrkH family potassium uptake protein [Alkalimonas sp. MEB108]
MIKNWDPHTSHYRTIQTTRQHFLALSPPAILALSFLMLILTGSVLLLLPMATTAPLTLLQALFTATSAVTVTGLVVVDTGSHFTLFGQLVIAALIQAGGLGFMTFAVIAAVSLGAKIGLGQQMAAQEAMGQTSLARVVQTAKAVLLYSLVIESIGFLLLTLTWWSELGLATASYHAFFYTISAFNNAGFALSADSLMPYAGSVAVNGIITALFIIGGIGFAVLIDLRSNSRHLRLSTNTRMVLWATLWINLIAFFVIWLLEYGNPATLASLSLADQALAAWFQAVTPRTAGFNTLPTDELTQATTVFTLLLMFIGGGSLSTASGIKVGTFVILLMATYAFLRRRQQVTLMKRTVPPALVMKALALTVVSMMLTFLAIFTLTVMEDADFLDIAFEAVSALSTVGLSRGLTGELSAAGQTVLIVLMIAGRLGPLTLAYFLATPKQKKVKYPESRFQVG